MTQATNRLNGRVTKRKERSFDHSIVRRAGIPLLINSAIIKLLRGRAERQYGILSIIHGANAVPKLKSRGHSTIVG